MENIFTVDSDFDFSKITLADPVTIQGGAYFTKIEFNEKPIYIQTTKSFTKQGIQKSGKKFYCDLMFPNNASDLINWFETLEEKCHELIYDKKDQWFQTPLDKNDIENAFNTIIKTYKSGKFYLVRTNIKSTPTNEANISVYNENYQPMSINEVNAESELISILEIQGIKFTSRNFQIEMILKQIMILDKEPLFDNCLIKRNVSNNRDETNTSDTINTDDNTSINIITDDTTNAVTSKHDVVTLENISYDNKIDDLEKNSFQEKDLENSITNQDLIRDNSDTNIISDDTPVENEAITIDATEIENLDIDDNLKEIPVVNNLENCDSLESITIRNPNKIYYDLYKKAREKAKQAKKDAIIAYLEARNIKNTYMLDDIEDDGDEDEEFESEMGDF